MRSPSKRRGPSKTSNTGIVRVVDLPDVIQAPPKRRVRLAPPVERGAALRPIKRRWQTLAGLARRWQLLAGIAALTWIWLMGGLALAWGLSCLSAPGPVTEAPPVVVEKPVEAPASPPVVEPKPTSSPVDEQPGSVKAGPTTTVAVSAPPPAAPEPKPISDRNTELLEALLARTQQQQNALAEQAKPKCVRCGTAVNLVCDPEIAARQAAQEHKLLFVIHLAGNLEESKFT